MRLVKNGLGLGGVIGALVALGVVACGDDFGNSDCRASRTCPTSGGDANGGGVTDENEAGSGAKSSGGMGQGEAGSGAEAGRPQATGCTVPAQCDDGDASNGVEMCNEGECAAGNPPPTVIEVSPESETTDVDPATAIVITFSEPLDAATVTTDSIKLIDGDTIVDGALTYADSQVTFTPSSSLALLAEYEVVVTTGVTDEAGAGLLEPYSMTFQTRDGIWVTKNAASGTLYQYADTVPVAANGDVLVAWTSTNGSDYCPTSVRWFNSGTGLGATTPLATGASACDWVAAGANDESVAAVVWQESAEHAKQFREGAWSEDKPTLSNLGSSWRFAIGVAPNGSVSFLQQQSSIGTFARSTDPEGAWGAAAENIASGHRGLGPARMAFSANSNGFAVWRAEKDGHTEVMVARYTPGGGWQPATILPGGVSEAPDNANYDMGTPAIAVDDDGGAVAVWYAETSARKVMVASHYTSATGWSDPVSISGTVGAPILTDAPGLVFDGKTYVAAWVGVDGANNYTYTAVYDAEFSEWKAFEPRTSTNVMNRMPQLAADSHQNLLMTWLVSTASGGKLIYARYDARAGLWSEAADVPGGAVKDSVGGNSLASSITTPLGVGANGFGALMWGDEDAQGGLTTIRLASFY